MPGNRPESGLQSDSREMSAPIQIPPYERKSVSSLKDLQPGDHILVTTKNAPRHGWAAWGRSWLPRSSSSCCPNAPVLPAGQQHMLVVSTETKKVRVIRASVDALCRDGTSEISRDPRTKRLQTRRESLARPSEHTNNNF